MDEVVAEQVDRRQLVHGDVEEALDLALVEVHRQQPVSARDADHVRDEPRRDGHPRLVLLVGSAVGVVRDHRGDAPCAGALEGVDHDQELHDRLLDGRAGGLDQVHVVLADVVQDLHEDVLVGELEHLDPTQGHVQVEPDLARPAPDWRCPRRGPASPSPDPGRRSEGAHAGRSPGVVPSRGCPVPARHRRHPARRRHSRSMPRCSASPARNTAMPATSSPSLRRITMTPACGAAVAVDALDIRAHDLPAGADEQQLLVGLGRRARRRPRCRSWTLRARSAARPGHPGAWSGSASASSTRLP